MSETITVSLPEPIKRKLDTMAEREHVNRNNIIKEALRQYFAIHEFRRLRGLMIPEAEQRGIYTDEDVFHKVS